MATAAVLDQLRWSRLACAYPAGPVRRPTLCAWRHRETERHPPPVVCPQPTRTRASAVRAGSAPRSPTGNKDASLTPRPTKATWLLERDGQVLTQAMS